MAFASHQAGSRVQADPACTGQKHFAPGMQVGEVGFRTAGAIDGFDIGLELNQIARDKTGGQAQVAEQLNLQPAGITAGAAGQLQCFFWRLHAGFHADGILDV